MFRLSSKMKTMIGEGKANELIDAIRDYAKLLKEACILCKACGQPIDADGTATLCQKCAGKARSVNTARAKFRRMHNLCKFCGNPRGAKGTLTACFNCWRVGKTKTH
jgi:hypothetical protein